MARPERFELPTTKFVAWYSIQLSYGRVEPCFFPAAAAAAQLITTRAVHTTGGGADYSDRGRVGRPFFATRYSRKREKFPALSSSGSFPASRRPRESPGGEKVPDLQALGVPAGQRIWPQRGECGGSHKWRRRGSGKGVSTPRGPHLRSNTLAQEPPSAVRVWDCSRRPWDSPLHASGLILRPPKSC